jgi:HlyD family secretion protein
VSETQVDNDRTNVQLAEAQVEDARAALRVAKEGARTDEQAAAQAQTVAAQAGVAQVEWLLQQKQVTAPVAGVIQELYVRQGEFATAGSTTMTILHTGSLRVRFFVPNDLRPKFLPGNQVAVEISGCDKPATARVTRVSARPEYTQPMMFSQELRDRLSFLTEARLETPTGCTAPPGTPVGVKVAGVAAKAS